MLVELRQAHVSYQGYHKYLITFAGCGAGAEVVDRLTGLKGYPAAAGIMAQGFATCADVHEAHGSLA